MVRRSQTRRTKSRSRRTRIRTTRQGGPWQVGSRQEPRQGGSGQRGLVKDGQDKMDQGVVAAVETAAINRIKVRKASLLLLQAGQDMPKQISFFPIQLNF